MKKLKLFKICFFKDLVCRNGPIIRRCLDPLWSCAALGKKQGDFLVGIVKGFSQVCQLLNADRNYSKDINELIARSVQFSGN